MIDDEIKKYRNLNATKQKQLLQSLSQAPSEIVTPLSSDQPVTTSQDDTLSIMPGELKVHETFASHFCKLSPTNLACSTQSCEHAAPAAIEQLLEECHQEVRKIRDCPRPKKLWHIFRDNKQLLFKFLFVLKQKYSLNARFRSIYRRFSKINNLPSRLIKKITNALQTRNLIDLNWLNKTSIDVIVNYANKAPILQICLNSCNTSAILDTGSTFSLIPYSIWQKLNINKNQLDQSVQFNINSASHNNPDAVLGRLHLNINIRDKHGVEQTILQNCLILRQHLDLAFVLLGNDFLKQNSVNISYHSSDVQPLISINNKEVTLLSSSPSDQSYFISSCLALPQNVPDPIERFHIPEPPERSRIPTPVSDPIESLDLPSLNLPTSDQLFHPDPDNNIKDIESFLQECKISKYKSYQQDLNVYSMQPVSLENMIEQNFEKKSIIPDAGLKNPTSNLSHLSPEIKQRLESIFATHKNLFSRSKHHLGKFVGFQAVANIDKNSKIKCRQAPRNKVLPPSCKQDLMKYKSSGLFDISTGLSDDYCANITLVLRNQIKEQRDNSKAGKYVAKQESKKTRSPSPNKPTSKTDPTPLDPTTPDTQRSLYRMTLDFRLLNLVTLNEKTAQLPSIQSIEANFFNANVTTIDLSNCYPSIEIAKSSRNYFNFFCEDQVWHHARLAQGWSASLQIAQRAVLWTFRDEALQAFLKMKGLTQSDFPFFAFPRALLHFCG